MISSPEDLKHRPRQPHSSGFSHHPRGWMGDEEEGGGAQKFFKLMKGLLLIYFRFGEEVFLSYATNFLASLNRLCPL